MTNFLHKWTYIIDFYRRKELQYVANNFIWSLTSLAYIVGTLFVYYFSNKIAFQEFVGYNFVSFVIFIFTNSWVHLDISARITGGQMSALLLTPTHFMNRYFAMFVGRNCFAYFVISIPAILLFAIFAIPYLNFEFKWYNFAITVLLLVGSYSISFWLNTLSGLATFWTTRNDAVNEFYFVLRNLLRGDMVILTTVATVAGWILYQPFAFIVHHPFMILTNKYNTLQILYVIFGSVLWTIILWLVARFVLKMGLKKYEGTGL